MKRPCVNPTGCRDYASKELMRRCYTRCTDERVKDLRLLARIGNAVDALLAARESHGPASVFTDERVNELRNLRRQIQRGKS